MRYCKLPLTEEEMRAAINAGLFSDVKSYFDYLDKQMCYGKDKYLSFYTSEIAEIINGHSLIPELAIGKIRNLDGVQLTGICKYA